MSPETISPPFVLGPAFLFGVLVALGLLALALAVWLRRRKPPLSHPDAPSPPIDRQRTRR